MGIFSGIMIYILVWWMMLFCVLPLNIESITKPTDGSMPGAPVHPHLKKKIILATILATIVWLMIYALIRADLVSFRDIAARMSM